MALDDTLLEAEEKMIKTEEVVQHEFAGVRTGKASPSLVENILVEVYGSQMRIRELAGITAPEPRMLLIQPWDAATVHPIEKAIQKSNLGLNPMVDKKAIRIVLPELSQERRMEFIKIVKSTSNTRKRRF
jgi:ribosome recycling factor